LDGFGIETHLVPLDVLKSQCQQGPNRGGIKDSVLTEGLFRRRGELDLPRLVNCLGAGGRGVGFPTVGDLLGSGVSVGKCVSLGSSESTQEQLYMALIEGGRHRPNQTPLLPCMSTSTPTSTPVNRRSQYAIDSWSEREGGCGHGVNRDGCVIISGFLSGSRTQ
jgi:hypothetical protein